MTRNTRVTTPELALQEAEANLFSLFPPLLMSSALTQCGRVGIDMAHGVRADWSCSGVLRQLPVSEVISWVLRIYAPGVKLDHVTFLSVYLSALCSLRRFCCLKGWEEIRQNTTQRLGNFLSRMESNVEGSSDIQIDCKCSEYYEYFFKPFKPSCWSVMYGGILG